MQAVRAGGKPCGGDHRAVWQLGGQRGQTAVEFFQQFRRGAVETVFRVAQFPHHDGQIAQFLPGRPHGAQKLLRVGFQLLRGKAVTFALMPDDRSQRGSPRSQFCLKNSVVKQKPRDWREGMKHSSTAQTMRHLRVEVMELCEGAGLYQIDLLSGSKERVSEAEYWARRRGQLKLDRENASLAATGQPPKKKFETVKDTLRKQILDVLDNAVNFEDFSDRLMQQYGIAVKESRGQLSYLPAGRTKFIRAKHLGDNYDKEAVLATLTANAEHKTKVQSKQDTIGKLIDIQSRMTEDKGIGYKRWITKHNLKAMAQTLIFLEEKGLTDEVALDQRITELDTKFHESLAVVKDLETRMADNKTLRRHAAAYTSTKNIAQQLKTANRPAAFEEQHRAELTAYRAAVAYFKANNITKLPSPKKLEAEYAQLASEKAKFYEQYKEAKEELLKLKTAKQNVASFFREEEQTQQER